MSHSIYVGMTHHNHDEYTNLALDSLDRGHPKIVREVVVWDDGSDRRFRRDLTNVIRQESSGGLINAWNSIVSYWLQSTSHDYCLITNNDVIFFERWDEEMIACFEENDDCGIVGPLTNHTGAGHQPSQRAFGPRGDEIAYFSRSVSHDRVTPAKLRFLKIPYVNGFCFMLRRDWLHAPEDFPKFFGSDQGHPHYGGEDWYQDRMRSCGYRAYVATRAFVYHFKDVSMNSAEQGRMGMQPEKLPPRIKERGVVSGA